MLQIGFSKTIKTAEIPHSTNEDISQQFQDLQHSLWERLASCLLPPAKTPEEDTHKQDGPLQGLEPKLGWL